MTPPPTTRRSQSPSRPWPRRTLMRSSPGCASARRWRGCRPWTAGSSCAATSRCTSWATPRRSPSTTRASRPGRWSAPACSRSTATSTSATARRSRGRFACSPSGSASPTWSPTRSTRLVDAVEPDGAAELRRAFAGPLAAAIVTHSLGLPEARHRRRPGLVRRDRRGRHRGHGRRRGARGRPRGVRGAPGRDRADARPRARLVAAGRRRRRPRALGRSSPTPRSCSSAASRRPRA